MPQTHGNWQSLLRFHMQMLAACPGSIDYNLLIPDVDSLRLLTYRDLLLRLANPSPMLYTGDALRFWFCSWYQSIREITVHLTPAFLYMCLFFPWSLVTAVKLLGPSCAGLSNHQHMSVTYCTTLGTLSCWSLSLVGVTNCSSPLEVL